MSNDQPVDFPHHRAAFINVIAEEGTKAEAVEWLQKIWNELCELKAIKRESPECEKRKVSLEKCGDALAKEWNLKYPRASLDRAIKAIIDSINEQTNNILTIEE